QCGGDDPGRDIGRGRDDDDVRTEGVLGRLVDLGVAGRFDTSGTEVGGELLGGRRGVLKTHVMALLAQRQPQAGTEQAGADDMDSHNPTASKSAPTSSERSGRILPCFCSSSTIGPNLSRTSRSTG